MVSGITRFTRDLVRNLICRADTPAATERLPVPATKTVAATKAAMTTTKGAMTTTEGTVAAAKRSTTEWAMPATEGPAP